LKELVRPSVTRNGQVNRVAALTEHRPQVARHFDRQFMSRPLKLDPHQPLRLGVIGCAV
jgi:hypothetical protein